MDLGLKGKGAIVTGGSVGIGAAIAIGLAKEGANVAITDVGRAEEGAAVVAQIEALGGKAIYVESDASSFDQAEQTTARAVEELGGVHLLVCNAGITMDGPIWKMTEEQFDTVIAVNLKGYFNHNRAAARLFMQQKYGKIVNISSINGLRGKFAQSNYAASKGGIGGLSKSLAKELGRFNVNVNVVAPGMVLTEMMQAVPMEFQAAALAETVVGRFATPEDIANTVTFLCSDLSRHITGEVIKVDGGQYI